MADPFERALGILDDVTERVLAEVPAGAVLFDAHTHLGDDIDGMQGRPEELLAIFDRIGQRFRRAVTSYAEANNIAVVRFAKDDRKVEVMGPYLKAAARLGGSRVAAIGVAQEYQNVFAAPARRPWLLRAPGVVLLP